MLGKPFIYFNLFQNNNHLIDKLNFPSAAGIYFFTLFYIMIQKSKQPIRKYFYLILCTSVINLHLCEYSYSKDTFFAETCYLEDDYVLLYKIINWWNDSEPGDDTFICSNHLRCELLGMSKLRYDSVVGSLTIRSNYQIEELLSIFKECKECKGPSHFICTYLNEKYFGTIAAKNIPPIYSTINSISIKGIANRQALQLIENEQKIGIEIKGIIGGLLLENGKIAFHQAGNFLKACPQSAKNQTDQAQTFITIKNFDKDEILARYKMVINEDE